MAKQKTKRSNAKYFLIIIPILLIIVAVYYFSQNSGTNQKQKVLSEISNLLTVSNQRSLTAADFSQLRSDVQNDPIALSYVDDAIWFADHNVQVHAGHNLSDLYNYFYYGKDQVCVPHEVEHIGDFIRYNDTSRIPSVLARINHGYADWYQNAISNEQKFPATYSNFNELSMRINRTLDDVQNGNYLNSFDDFSYITQYDYEGCVIS
jgi:hypothetical protein